MLESGSLGAALFDVFYNINAGEFLKIAADNSFVIT